MDLNAPVFVTQTNLNGEKHPSNVSKNASMEAVSSNQLELLLKQQKDAMLLMASSVRSGFEMPKMELQTFDGDPVNYWTFIHNFETNIEKRVPDAESKLTYI
jgi:hypothetical protein